MARIRVNDELTISDKEIEFDASTGGGPGGQNVNRVATKVTLRFDVARSPSLDDEQRRLLLENLESRLTKDGVLWVTSQEHRSQRHNRKEAREQLLDLLREGLKKPKKRKPTKRTRGSHRRRLQEKKRRAEIKRGRSRKWRRDDY